MRRNEGRAPSLVELESATKSQIKAKSGMMHVGWKTHENKAGTGNDLQMWGHNYSGSDQNATDSWRSNSSFYHVTGDISTCQAYCKRDGDCAAFEVRTGSNSPDYCVFKDSANSTNQNGVSLYVITVTWASSSGKDVAGTDTKVMAEQFSSSHIGEAVGQWCE